MPQQRDSSIAIVGGGIAGVHTALLCNLHHPECTVWLVEQSGRLGGRIYARTDKDGKSFPMGAWRYHLQHTPRTARLVAELNIRNTAWPYRLAKLIVGDRIYDLDAALPSRARGWDERVWQQLHAHREADVVSLDALVAAVGYNCLSQLPADCAADLFDKLPERNPQGWVLPDGGFAAVFAALVERLTSRTRIVLNHRLTRIQKLSDAVPGYELHFDGPAHRTVHVDKVVLALPGHELAAIAGKEIELVRQIGSSIGTIPKFRAWLCYDDDIAGRITLGANSIVFTTERPRKIYIGSHHVMIYNDLADAEQMAAVAACGPGALGVEVAKALDRFCGYDTKLAEPAAVHWKYWSHAINFLMDDMPRRRIDRLPYGLAIANEALSDHHGFIEGALESSRAAYDRLW